MPFQGANETFGYKPQGDAVGYVRHWAFSPSLLNPKLKLVNVRMLSKCANVRMCKCANA